MSGAGAQKGLAFPELGWDGIPQGEREGRGLLSSAEQQSVGQRGRDIEDEVSRGSH